MSFAPSHILTPMSDRSAFEAVTSLRVMNEWPLTNMQLAELEHQFARHKMILRASCGTFLAHGGELSDGSKFRFISNGARHDVLVWPAHGVATALAEILRVFCTPADTTHQFGWMPPVVVGANGTTATVASAKSGVSFRLKQSGPEHTLKGTHLKRFLRGAQFTAHNAAFFTAGNPNNTSAQKWENREWISDDRKTCLTTHQGLRLNDVALGDLVVGSLWACLHKFDAGDGRKEYMIVVALQGKLLKIYRAPLSTLVFTQTTSFDLSTLDAEAVSNAGNSFATLYNWIGKIAHNKSKTVLSVWVQNPHAETYGAEWPAVHDFFVGIVDFNLQTGELIGSTQAQGETVATTSADGGFSGTFAVTGARQVGFQYVDDTKVFTELQFAGEFSCSDVYTQDDSSSPHTYSWSRGSSDNRTVTLVIGDFSMIIGEASVTEDSQTAAGVVGDTSSLATSYSASHTSCYIAYQNGSDMFQRFAAHSAISVDHSDDTITLKVHKGSLEVDLGERSQVWPLARRWGSSDTGSLVPRRIPWFIADPGSTTRWGGANRVNMGLVYSCAPLTFAAPDAADTSSFNGRAIDGFVIISCPKLRMDGDFLLPNVGPPLDPTKFVTYCSDTDILAKLNVDATLGVLKGICFI